MTHLNFLGMCGGATAAHQVQGSKSGNWTDWERSELRRKALREAGHSDEYIWSNFISGEACLFEERHWQDLLLAKRLRHTALRFGVNPASIEPTPDTYDANILKRYRAIIRYSKALHIEPIVTLYHWTHPSEFERKGGWTQGDAPEIFARFVKETLPYLEGVKYFCVLNEPNVYSNFSYRWGIWPPQIADEDSYQRAAKNLRHAHVLAYDLIKERHPDALVGIAQSAGWGTSDDPAIVEELDRWHTEDLDVLQEKLDFIGINVYARTHRGSNGSTFVGMNGQDVETPHPVLSDFGWAMCPQALARVAERVFDRYKLPIMVTEHGHAVAEIDDHRRCWYLWESLKHLAEIQDRVPLLGYLHWSLMDNFEWAAGFRQQFGLIHIKRPSLERIPRTSAYLLRDIITAGGLTEEIAVKYASIISHPQGVNTAV